MISEIIDIYERDFDSEKRSLLKWNIPEKEKKNLLRFLDELGLGQVNGGKKVSEARQSKYITLLRTPMIFWSKDLDTLTLKDVESFEKALNSNSKEIKTTKKEGYGKRTKSDIRRAVKIYLKWRVGNDKGIKLAGWLDTRDVVKTPEYLKEQEAEKLYKNCKSARERFIIAVLFDGGTRAGEFFNIRYEDIEMPKGNDNFVKITLKEEYSKTKGRTISLYWKYSLEAVRDYLSVREKEGMKNQEAVYKGTYDNLRFFLMRLGKKVLGKSIYVHLFRHSSATYYATKLNRQQLCYRYGWRFSSDMPDVYISRSGMNNEEVDEKVSSTKIEDLKAELEQEKQRNKIEQENIVEELNKIKKAFGELLIKKANQEITNKRKLMV